MKRLNSIETISNEELFRIMNRNNIRRGRVIDHHKPILLPLEPIHGLYMPEFDIKTKKWANDYYEGFISNKGYRNFAYLLHGAISGTDQTLIDTGGTNRTVPPNRSREWYGASGNWKQSYWPFTFGFNFGSSLNPHDVTRYELYSRFFGTVRGGISWIEELDVTRLQTYYIYAFPSPDRSMGEVGLYWLMCQYTYYWQFLLARAIIDPPVSKSALTEYTEGWRVTFPSNYTRWFLRAFYETWGFGPTDWGRFNKDINGSDFIQREKDILAGNADAMIGRNNTSPSPTDYALKDPIGSLSSQSQSVELDTTIQESRVVRIGTYTPPENETLGEIGLFTQVYDVGGTARKIMVARGVWDPAVTLVGSTTYTIGIVLRLG